MKRLDPMLEPAQDAIRRLEKRAGDIEWEGGDLALARSLRDEAKRLRDSGDAYLPTF